MSSRRGEERRGEERRGDERRGEEKRRTRVRRKGHETRMTRAQLRTHVTHDTNTEHDFPVSGRTIQDLTPPTSDKYLIFKSFCGAPRAAQTPQIIDFQ